MTTYSVDSYSLDITCILHTPIRGTSVIWHRWTVRRRYTQSPIALHTKLDAEYDQQVTAVDRLLTMLTTLYRPTTMFSAAMFGWKRFDLFTESCSVDWLQIPGFQLTSGRSDGRVDISNEVRWGAMRCIKGRAVMRQLALAEWCGMQWLPVSTLQHQQPW